MQRILVIATLLFAPYCIFAQTAADQKYSTVSEIHNFTISISNLNDYYAEVIGYYLNKPLYAGDFNIHNLKQDINAAIYTIDPNSPNEKDNNAPQLYLDAKYNTKNFLEKEELVTLVSKAENSTEQIKINCMTLSNYFSNKEYNQDPNFSKYPILREKLQNSILAAQDAWIKVKSYNDDVKDAVETQMLERKKAADFIIPMKEDKDKLKRIVKQIYSQDFSLIILKMDLSDLQATTEIHKDFSRKNLTKLKDESYISVYKRFYTTTDEAINIVKQILNCVEQKKYDAELDRLFDQLNTVHNKIEEDYKLFASQE